MLIVEGLSKVDFLTDKRTQQAVIMSLVIIGEAATKVMDGSAEFTQAHPQVPWRSMRGMRNRIAHGYFDINFDVVWETVQTALPDLLKQLPAVRQDAEDEDRNNYGHGTMTDRMALAELKEIIEAAGGKCWALDYAEALLKKINRLEAEGKYTSLFSQLRSAKEPGDFRGRVLEVNFADLFVEKDIELRYEASQGMSGDVDFCWHVNADQVFIEMKLLGQDQKTREVTAQQLLDTGISMVLISDDTKDVARIQRDIFLKSSTRKFNPKPKSTWINLVAVDLSELQLGTVDIGDCLLASGGNELVARHCHHTFQRPAVVGVFEPADKTVTTEQADWVKCYHSKWDANTPHLRDYLHGVLFLFREPKERAALSYALSGVIVWNPALIDDTRGKPILEAFHQIVPRAELNT